jgi:hypothetical protein
MNYARYTHLLSSNRLLIFCAHKESSENKKPPPKKAPSPSLSKKKSFEMGVPKFYRWLSERYPLINQMISNSSMLPEIDNFYLDMNGIIHACTHANGTETSVKLSLRDMVLAIFRYIDRCVSGIVKPKKLLYLAIDGVAPRAKLNQQRSRRFRAGQERFVYFLLPSSFHLTITSDPKV